jgi:disulfide bond formation protein DsbB
MFVFAVISLGFAYFTQFVLGFEPCPLCLYQRIPYFFIIVISIIAITYKKIYKLGLILIVLAILSSILISGYHVGVERKIFSPPETCQNTNQIKENLNLEDYLKFIDNKQAISCVEPQFTIFGLSMADYNFLINLFILYNLILFIRLN